MYAIVNIAGQQFKVSQDAPVFVHRLDANEGDSVPAPGTEVARFQVKIGTQETCENPFSP